MITNGKPITPIQVTIGTSDDGRFRAGTRVLVIWTTTQPSARYAAPALNTLRRFNSANRLWPIPLPLDTGGPATVQCRGNRAPHARIGAVSEHYAEAPFAMSAFGVDSDVPKV